MNYFEYVKMLREGKVVAQDGIDFAKHDKRYHHGNFVPSFMSCSLRHSLSKMEEEDTHRHMAGGGGGVTDAASEAKRQYDEVVAHYTNPDGTMNPGWMKAPNGKDTKLTQDQWVHVRTQNFKRWFGDWETLAKIAAIMELKPIFLPTDEFVPNSKLQLKNLFSSFGDVKNDLDGRDIIFPRGIVGKIRVQSGVKDVGRFAPAFKEAFEKSIPAFVEEPDVIEGHKDHYNYSKYRHYVGKIKNVDGEFYVRFTITEEVSGKRDEFHASTISEISIYENKGAASSGPGPKPGGNTAPFVDDKLSNFLTSVNPQNVSKIIDENGEPMVVFHGSNHTHTEFDNRKSDFRNNTPDGHSFFSDKRSVAASYTPMGEGADVIFEKSDWPYVDVKFKDGRTERQYYDSGGVYSVFLSLKNPLVVDAHGDEWSAVRFDGKRMATNEISAIAAKRGHDSVVFTNVIDGAARHKPEPSTTLVAFAPEQVKSATHNNGVFSETDPNINH